MRRMTPQASSANVIFAGTGYLAMGEIYRVGLLATVGVLGSTLIIGFISQWVLSS